MTAAVAARRLFRRAVPDAPTLAVVAALRLEQSALRRGLPATRVLLCGMGASRLERAFTDFELPDALVTAGVCGAVSPGLKPGDVVVASEIRDDAGVLPLPAAAPLVAELRARGYTVHFGPMQSSTTVVHGSRRNELAAKGVLAADMESGPIVRAVKARVGAGRLPALAVVRVVVDTPGQPLMRVNTATGGVRALRALTTIGPALRAWSAAVGERTVLLAGPRSFCAGVERAIDIVDRALYRYPAPIYVRRQIVHNSHVVAGLESRGAVFVEELSEVPDGATVILSAHGVAPTVRVEAEGRGMRVIDATCPLVAKVHAETRRFLGHGSEVILIGHHNHDETEGTVGEDPKRVTIVDSVESARTMPFDDPENLAYVTQTTLATDEAEEIASALRDRFPSIAQPPTEDICYATTNRQHAVRAVAADADLVLVLGSQNSSNSLRLAEVANRAGTTAYLVDDASGIRPEWLVDADTVGITAGASAPPKLVDEVVTTLRALGTVGVREVTVAREDLTFTLPKEVDN